MVFMVRSCQHVSCCLVFVLYRYMPEYCTFLFICALHNWLTGSALTQSCCRYWKSSSVVCLVGLTLIQSGKSAKEKQFYFSTLIDWRKSRGLWEVFSILWIQQTALKDVSARQRQDAMWKRIQHNDKHKCHSEVFSDRWEKMSDRYFTFIVSALVLVSIKTKGPS